MQTVIRLGRFARGCAAVTHSGITEQLPDILHVRQGILNLLVITSNCSISIGNTGKDGAVDDVFSALARVVKDCQRSSAVGATLLGTSLDLVVRDGQIDLGEGRGLVLCQWDDEPKEVNVRATLVSDSACGKVEKYSFGSLQRGCHLVTHDAMRGIQGALSHEHGLVAVQLASSGAALSVNENCDATVRSDMKAAFEHMVPESHYKGDIDVAGQARSALIGGSVSVPVSGGSPAWGTWQGLYLCRLPCQSDGSRPKPTISAVQAKSTGQTRITLQAPSRGCHDVTSSIQKALNDIRKGQQTGLVNLFIQHTSAAITVAAKGMGEQLEVALNHVVPERWNREFFEHTYEGPDDMPGHVKSTLVGCSVTVPVSDGSLALGEDLAVYLCEHRNTGGWGGGHSRKIVVTFVSV